jgi:diphthine-ammonia ligase
MRLAVLFSGGKDSTFALWKALGYGYDVACLVSIVSANKNSFMFHTPSIKRVKVQAKAMGLPLIFKKSKGEEEKELVDLEKAIARAVKKYGIKGVVTGAVESVYQASRIQRVCDKLGLEVFNPLWQKDQVELLRDLVREGFDVRVVGVAAEPLGKDYLGRKVDRDFVAEFSDLAKSHGINPAGEGGEYESFVLNGPVFKEKLRVVGFKDYGEKFSWVRELRVKRVRGSGE